MNWTFRRRKVIAGLLVVGVLLLAGFALIRSHRADVRQLPTFQRGMVLLRSSDRADVEKAADLFGHLSGANPRTGWPLLYAKVAACQLGQTDLAGRLLGEAMTRSDAIEVFSEYLASGADDADVALALARIYRKNQDLDQAERYLYEARRCAPNHSGVLADLAELNWKKQDRPAAIDYYQQAIRAAAAQARPGFIPQFRQNLSNALIAEVDQCLLDPATPPPPAEGPLRRVPRVVELLAMLEDQLEQLAVAWEADIEKRPNGNQARTLSVCRASLASAYGYYEGRRRKDVGLAEFRRARYWLNQAEKMDREVEDSGDSGSLREDRDFAPQLIRLKVDLERRLEACGIELESL